MPSTGTFTVTGTAGPGNALTAQVFNNVTSFAIDISKQMLTLEGGDAGPNPKYIAISAATTITVTLAAAAGNYTVVIS